ncbi:MAG: hypothetical protein JW699_06350, partial [Chitinispirillaceae bacterium]|nr:hypothetical protein [Chitinispirillaceae bacterium]
MSSATVRNISASDGPPSGFMSAAGLAAAAAQVIFLREYLTVFSGNELVIGLIFALWLLAAAAGSRAGRAFTFSNWRLLSFLYVVSVVLGVLLLRASRLLFLPGETVAPWSVALIVLLTQSDAAFFGGLVYGRLARRGGGARLYVAENTGSASGLLLAAACILLCFPNAAALAAALAFFAAAAFWLCPDAPSGGRSVWSTLFYYAGTAVVLAGFLALDPVSLRWKYASHIDRVVSGRGGEIALQRAGGGNVFLNGVLYRAAMPLPSIEQAVHLPAAAHKGPLRRALVAGDGGQVRELRKYAGLSIVCLETEPALADSG